MLGWSLENLELLDAQHGTFDRWRTGNINAGSREVMFHSLLQMLLLFSNEETQTHVARDLGIPGDVKSELIN